jgi:sulfate/thiosulfate transport system permease protein
VQATSVVWLQRVVNGTNGRSNLVAPGITITYLSLIVLLPLAALVARAASYGSASFWHAIASPGGKAALELSLASSIAVAAVNGVMGTAIAWTLVRDKFPGRSVVNAIIDLPFALPTIVAGLILLVLYGHNSPLGINVAYTRAGVALALLFVTLPFVVRSVQPVLMELDREMEEAAESLGAGKLSVFARIIMPSLFPAIISGASLSFARAVGEFGSLVLISGNIPFRTEVASVHIFGQIESGDLGGAAANSVLLLSISLLVVLGLRAIQWVQQREV